MEGTCDLELGLLLRPHDDRDVEGARTLGRAQLTMMYNGEVCVCEDVSEAKAKAILLLASRGAAEGERRRTRPSGVDGLTLTLDPPPVTPPPVKSWGSATLAGPTKGCNNAMSAMYMKRSLQRFLEKRKLRLQRSNASPY